MQSSHITRELAIEVLRPTVPSINPNPDTIANAQCAVNQEFQLLGFFDNDVDKSFDAILDKAGLGFKFTDIPTPGQAKSYERSDWHAWCTQHGFVEQPRSTHAFIWRHPAAERMILSISTTPGDRLAVMAATSQFRNSVRREAVAIRSRLFCMRMGTILGFYRPCGLMHNEQVDDMMGVGALRSIAQNATDEITEGLYSAFGTTADLGDGADTHGMAVKAEFDASQLSRYLQYLKDEGINIRQFVASYTGYGADGDEVRSVVALLERTLSVAKAKGPPYRITGQQAIVTRDILPFLEAVSGLREERTKAKAERREQRSAEKAAKKLAKAGQLDEHELVSAVKSCYAHHRGMAADDTTQIMGRLRELLKVATHEVCTALEAQARRLREPPQLTADCTEVLKAAMMPEDVASLQEDLDEALADKAAAVVIAEQLKEQLDAKATEDTSLVWRTALSEFSQAVLASIGDGKDFFTLVDGLRKLRVTAEIVGLAALGNSAQQLPPEYLPKSTTST